MSRLVISKKEGIFCDSQMVAKKFGKRHIDIVSVIDKLLEDLQELRHGTNLPKVIQKLDVYRGQEFHYYEMDREFFSLLAMRFRGKIALEWQIKFNRAFYQMEKMLLQEKNNKQSEEWIAQREQSKLIRRDLTDVIKDFVEYATAQGSTKASFYYKNITNAIYKCLDLIQFEKPKIRETLDLMETHCLVGAEYTARNSLAKYMNNKEHYKTIYELVKQDIEKYADLMLLPKQLK